MVVDWIVADAADGPPPGGATPERQGAYATHVAQLGRGGEALHAAGAANVEARQELLLVEVDGPLLGADVVDGEDVVGGDADQLPLQIQGPA